MDETYERILLEIDEEKQEYAIRLLRCLAFSRRPLRAKELAEVLAIQFDTAIPMLDTSLRPEDAHEAVLSACSTLVTTVGLNDVDYGDDYLYHYHCENYASHIVQFSHHSVKEFLTSERLAKSDKRDLSQFYISPKSAHTILAQSCISTLLQPDIHNGAITDTFPLADYAAQNWSHHAQCDGVASQIQGGMERLFDPDRKHFSMWISIHDNDIDYRWPHESQTKPSPLYYAALCGIGSLVEHLVTTRRQDPNGSHGRQGTPLHVAAVSGNTVVARLLLEHTADVDARDMNTMTPLQAAVGNGNFDIAQLLLTHGADVNSLDHRRDSPLHEALRSGKFDVARLLVESCADVNAWNMFHVTPLHEAARSGNLEIVQLLLDHGADADTLDHRRDSPLREALRFGKFEVVEILAKSGANVNASDINNVTPLHEAAGSGKLDIVRLLLSHGADVNPLDRWKNSPLHEALRFGKFEVVEILVKSGADVNIRDIYDTPPLHKAVEGRKLDIVRLLLCHGADVNALDRQGRSPLRKALRFQALDVMELLLKRGANVNDQIHNPTLFHEAVASRNIDAMKILLSHGADVNALDYFGNSPLHKVLQSPVNVAANVNIWDRHFMLPLRASQQGNYATAQLLLGHGADVNARGQRRKTPLHLSSLGGSLDISQLLVEHGADIDAQDDEGRTPFSIALENGHRKLAHFLSNDRVAEHDRRVRGEL